MVRCCLQSEIANRRAQQNNFVRQLGDISRTLKSMGLYHQVQVSYEHAAAVLPTYLEQGDASAVAPILLF